MAATSTELRLGQRFCGPPGIVNGGFACGSIVALAGGAAEVTLRRPLPLGRPLAVRYDDGAGVLRRGGWRRAARPGPPGRRRGRAGRPRRCVAQRGARGGRSRPLLPGPGLPRLLCLRAGPPARRRAADLPRAGGRPPAVGGTVDTGPLGRRRRRNGPAGGGLGGARLPQRARRGRGRPPARRHLHPARPDDGQPGRAARAGDRCRVLAWPGGRDGRKLAACSALLGPGGQVLAAARTVWVTVPRPPSGAAAGSGVVTARRRGVAFTPMETRRDVIVRAARLADELGYEAFARARGLGPGLDPCADRDRAAHPADQARLRCPVGLGPHPRNAGDDRRDPSRDLRGPLRAGSGRQHQSARGGLPRHRLRASCRQAAGRHDAGPGAAGRRARPRSTGCPGARPLRLGQPPVAGSADLARRDGRPHASGWPPSSAMAGSPPWLPGTGWPAGPPSSTGCAKPPAGGHRPSPSRPGP